VSNGGTVTIAHSNSSNTANFTFYSYGDEAEVFRMIDNTYFIGTNPAGVPALYRRPLDGNAEEIVDNVENIVMRFGIDTDNDFVVNRYVSAGAVTNWRQVLTARLSLVFRSNSNNVATQVQPYVIEGTTVTPASTDRRLRQVATATYGLRNRLP
jgi:type IV pilus assembly protein PilW